MSLVSKLKKICLNVWKGNEKNFPNLFKLARKYLTTTATSSPVERLFSIAELTFRPDRCKLSNDTFETLMVIRHNSGWMKCLIFC